MALNSPPTTLDKAYGQTGKRNGLSIRTGQQGNDDEEELDDTAQTQTAAEGSEIGADDFGVASPGVSAASPTVPGLPRTALSAPPSLAPSPGVPAANVTTAAPPSDARGDYLRAKAPLYAAEAQGASEASRTASLSRGRDGRVQGVAPSRADWQKQANSPFTNGFFKTNAERAAVDAGQTSVRPAIAATVPGFPRASDSTQVGTSGTVTSSAAGNTLKSNRGNGYAVNGAPTGGAAPAIPATAGVTTVDPLTGLPASSAAPAMAKLPGQPVQPTPRTTTQSAVASAPPAASPAPVAAVPFTGNPGPAISAVSPPAQPAIDTSSAGPAAASINPIFKKVADRMKDMEAPKLNGPGKWKGVPALSNPMLLRRPKASAGL